MAEEPEKPAKAPVYLDPNQKQKTAYCIPEWVKNLQIHSAIAKVRARIEPGATKSDEPVAIVCFGPSLQDTWEKVREFKYIFTCSGAHKFLLDHGIKPGPDLKWWHIEVDPREHKVELLGPPQQGIVYLPASTCHPKYFDHLEGFDVRLWHVFDATEDAVRVLPRGEWAITGGANVGLRAMTIARFFGYRNQHVFGMDGCEKIGGPERRKHASPHPLQDGQGFSLCEYEGVTYRTTPSLLECARQTWHELNQMPDVKATFYGEGLVQAMAKNYKPEPIAMQDATIAFNRPELISATYCDLNRKLHEENLYYGVGGAKHAPTVLKLVDAIKSHSVLDYGAGKGFLAAELPFPIWEYDPAIPGKDTPPRPADLVVCTDVLEHIEPDKILFVLDDLRRVTRKVGFFVIHTGPSSKSLADGRNAHLLQRNAEWWRNMLSKFFEVGKIAERPPLLHVIVGPKTKKKKEHIVQRVPTVAM